MKYFIAIAFFISLLVGTTSAHADLLSGNDAVFGVGAVTIDTRTNLEWLDLTVSAGMSNQQVNVALLPGGALQGWTYATNNQVMDLLQNSLSMPAQSRVTFYNTNSGTYASDLALINSYTSYFGNTMSPALGTSYSGALGMTNDAVPNSTVHISRFGAYTGAGSYVYFESQPNEQTPLREVPYSYTGSYLIRTPATPTIPSVISTVSTTQGGYSVRQGTDPNGPVVVITHGWQPGEAVAMPQWTLDMAAGIQSRNPAATIVTYLWSAAFTENTLGVPDLSAALPGIKSAADELAAIVSQFGSRPVQMIGHSLGTEVNAFAALQLNQLGYPVDQFTVLDRPFGTLLSAGSLGTLGLATARAYQARENELFQQVVSLSDSFDNYYGTDQSSLTPAVGALVVGATHNRSLPEDHVGVHDWYFGTVTHPSVGDGFQCSFIVNQSCFDLFDGSKVLISRNSLLSANFISGNGTTNGWSTYDASILSSSRALFPEHSPAYLWSNFAIPNGSDCMSFDYNWQQPGDGDYLTVTFGQRLLFSYLGSSFSGSNSLNSGCVAVGDLAGLTDQLLFALNSVGLPNALFEISNLEFYALAELVAVSEPSLPIIVIFGWGLLVFLRNRQPTRQPAAGVMVM